MYFSYFYKFGLLNLRQYEILNSVKGKIKMGQESIRTTKGRKVLYNSIVDTIGDTPCVRINRLGPAEINIYVKAEFFNPAGSVKDRLAISIVEEPEKRGALRPGQTIV